MLQHHLNRRAQQLALLSFILAVGCTSTGVQVDSVGSRARGRPSHRVDSGATPSDSGPPRDAATLTDAAAPRDTGIDAAAPRDTGTDAAPRDAGTDGGPTTTAVWRPFNDTSPWNTRIPAGAPIRPDSAALISSLRTSSEWPGLHVSIYPWTIPLYPTSSAVPLVPVYATLSNEGTPYTFMWPVPSTAAAAPEADGHLLLIDRVLGRGYDFYQGRRRADGSWDCTLCATSDLTGSGVRPPKGGPAPWYESHGSRACGFPLVAGMIRVEEVQAGRIDHALTLAYPGLRQRWFRSPASTGHPANGIITPNWGIPCGGRVQLDPTLDLDTLPLTPAARMIARALQEYGAYVGDFSGSIDVNADGSPSARDYWSTGVLDSNDVTAIPLERMRVLEWGTLISDG